MATGPGEIRQAFVELPYWPGSEVVPPPLEIPVRQNPQTPPRVPLAGYRLPAALEVHLWQAAPAPANILPPEARRLLDSYLEFSRFPILVGHEQHANGLVLTWLDLRFSVPGRTIPFVLQLHLDQDGRLVAYHIGGVRLPFPRSAAQSPRSG